MAAAARTIARRLSPHPPATPTADPGGASADEGWDRRPTRRRRPPPGEARPVTADDPGTTAAPPRRRIAVRTVIFSVATGFSRIAGLIREIVAASLYGTSGPASAFTLAFQIPNLVGACSPTPRSRAPSSPSSRSCSSSAKREAYALAGALGGLLIVAARHWSQSSSSRWRRCDPAFTGREFTPALDDAQRRPQPRAVPDRGAARAQRPRRRDPQRPRPLRDPAIAPLVWNLVIIVGIVIPHAAVRGRRPALRVRDRRRVRARSSSSSCASRCCGGSASRAQSRASTGQRPAGSSACLMLMIPVSLSASA